MALTGTLLANFSDFNTAVEQSQIKLRGFETSAGKVGTALSRMTDTFSGRQITSEATLMVAAIERVGGVSKLTEAELKRVGATASEAAAKLRAMGAEVPVGIQKIADAAKNASAGTNTFASSLKNVNSLLGAFGVSLSVGALVGFGKSVLDLADNLVRVADRTGLTTTEVQKLQYIAEQSGNSLDDFTGAIGKLQAGLVGGDKGVAAAVKVLGLNLQELRSANPYDQMQQISEAIGGIPDPAARAALAIELFGQQGAAILPTLIADFKKLGDEAPVMADKTVRALDTAGDQLGRFFSQMKVWAAESYNFVGRQFDVMVATINDATAGLLRGVAKMLDFIPGSGKALAALGTSTDDLRKKAQFFNDSADATRAALSRVDVEVRKVVPAYTAFDGILNKTKKSQDATKEAMEKAAKAAGAMVQHYRTLWDSVDRGGASIAHLGTVIKGDFDNALKRATDMADFLAVHFRQLWDSVEFGGNSLRGLGQSFGKLDIDIGKATRSLTDSLKSLASGDFKTVFKDFGDFMKGGLGKVGTGFLESIGGGIFNMLTNLAMKGLGVIGKGIGKLFGIDKEHEKVNDLRDAFEKLTFGSLHNMNAAFQKVGLTVDRVLSAKKVKDFDAAVEEFNRKLALQQTAWGKVQAAIERYGFSLEQLGPALQRQKLSETAVQLYEDFLLLTGAGIDTEVVLTQMADKINAFTQMAVKMGIQVDLSMKPLIQKMIDMGLLVDENGNLITSLEDSGITFSESLTDAFAAVADQLSEMVDLLRLFLGLTEQIPSVAVPVPSTGNGGSGSETGNTGPDVQGRYLSAGALSRFGGRVSLAAQRDGLSNARIEALLVEQNALLMRAEVQGPARNARAVRDAVQTARVRRG